MRAADAGSEVLYGQVFVLAFLYLLAREDLREKSFPLTPILLGLAGGLSYGLLSEEPLAALAGGGFGIALTGLANATRGKLGEGDGLAVAVCGLYLGFWKAFVLLFLGLLLGCAFGLGQMAAGKAGRDRAYPFLPFLLAAYLGVLCLW